MKKNILAIVLIISVNNIASAQFIIGPKVGLNISKEYYAGIELVNAGNEDIKYKTGINIGIFGKYVMGSRFDLQAELLYSQQGFKQNISLADYGGIIDVDEYKFSSQYFNIPLILKFYPLKSIYIEVGPQVGLYLKSTSGFVGYSRDYKTMDFSLIGGIGTNIGYGLSINARYNHGLTQILPSDWKNRVFQISLTYDLCNF